MSSSSTSFVPVRGDDGVVTCHGESVRLPVEQFHEGCFIIEVQQLFMRSAELGIAVIDLNPGLLERLARLGILLFAAPARGIEHDLDFEPRALWP